MFKPFVEEIAERFKLPWKFFAFNCYLVFIVVGFGGLGVFIQLLEVIKSPESDGYKVAQGMATYSVAIIGASLVDLNLSVNIKSKPSLTIISIALACISMLLMYLSYNIESFWALLPSFSAVAFALLIWTLANADNPNLSDSTYFEKMRGKDIGHGQNW